MTAAAVAQRAQAPGKSPLSVVALQIVREALKPDVSPTDLAKLAESDPGFALRIISMEQLRLRLQPQGHRRAPGNGVHRGARLAHIGAVAGGFGHGPRGSRWSDLARQLAAPRG